MPRTRRPLTKAQADRIHKDKRTRHAQTIDESLQADKQVKDSSWLKNKNRSDYHGVDSVKLSDRKRKFDVKGQSMFFKFHKFGNLRDLKRIAVQKRKQRFWTRIIPYRHPKLNENKYALWIRPK